jgi:hypothetical protein
MEDEKEINRVVLDYIEGWYEGNAERMRHALSPHLAKRRIVSCNEIWDVTRDWMVEATGKGDGRIEYPENGRKEISILDRTESMASVRVFSEQYVDYLHLAKPDGAWVIVNALWDFIVKN